MPGYDDINFMPKKKVRRILREEPVAPPAPVQGEVDTDVAEEVVHFKARLPLDVGLIGHDHVQPQNMPYYAFGDIIDHTTTTNIGDGWINFFQEATDVKIGTLRKRRDLILGGKIQFRWVNCAFPISINDYPELFDFLESKYGKTKSPRITIPDLTLDDYIYAGDINE
jgi:hypothetical protein